MVGQEAEAETMRHVEVQAAKESADAEEEDDARRKRRPLAQRKRLIQRQMRQPGRPARKGENEARAQEKALRLRLKHQAKAK
jgi:hypothetical protein